MLNFAERTGSGAVILVWSFLIALPVIVIRSIYVTNNLEEKHHITYITESNMRGVSFNYRQCTAKVRGRVFVRGKTGLCPDKR